MAINYPLTLPITSGIRQIELMYETANAVTTSRYTYQQQVQINPGQRWTADVMLAKMTQADASYWQAFFLSLNGNEGTFLLGDPSREAPLGSALGSPQVNGASQTGAELITDGWDPNETGLLLPGDYIELPGNRLHMVLTQVNSDGLGNATLDIWPNLRESPADDTVISTINTRGIFRMSSSSGVVQNVDHQHVVTLSFSCVEAI